MTDTPPSVQKIYDLAVALEISSVVNASEKKRLIREIDDFLYDCYRSLDWTSAEMAQLQNVITKVAPLLPLSFRSKCQGCERIVGPTVFFISIAKRLSVCFPNIAEELLYSSQFTDVEAAYDSWSLNPPIGSVKEYQGLQIEQEKAGDRYKMWTFLKNVTNIEGVRLEEALRLDAEQKKATETPA